MNILGISDSHEAHACLLTDGEIISVMAEERLSRLKADMGYPKRAIESVLKISGLKSDDLDFIVFAGTSGNHFQRIYKPNALFSVKDWIDQCEFYWKPVLIEKKNLNSLDDFHLFKHLRGNELKSDPYYPYVEMVENNDANILSAFNNLRKLTVSNHLNIDETKVSFIRHEDCHKIYGFHSNHLPDLNERALVFTIEGGGDDSSRHMAGTPRSGEQGTVGPWLRALLHPGA